jgi:hypothetical protein
MEMYLIGCAVLFVIAVIIGAMFMPTNENFKILHEEDTKSYILTVHYEGGHGSYATPTRNGILAIRHGMLCFYNSSMMKCFTIDVKSIDKIVYDTSERITLTRALTIGIGSLIFKKKTYYLIIDYTSGNNVKNQVVIETGSEKHQKFFNILNVERNK